MTSSFRSIPGAFEVFKRIKEVSMDVKTDEFYPNAKRPPQNPGYKSKLLLAAVLLLAPFSFSCDKIHHFLKPNEGKIGFIGHKGQYVLKPQFDWIQGFKGNVAAVEVKTLQKSADGSQYFETSKMGAIDIHGTLVVPLEYRTVRAIGDGFIMAQNEKGWVLMDETGKNVSARVYDDQFGESGNGLVSYRQYERDGNYEAGFLDKNGNPLFREFHGNKHPSAKRNYDSKFGEGLVWAQDAKGYLLVNLKGEVASRFQSAGVALHDRRPFAEGFSAVATGFQDSKEEGFKYTKWGYVNTKGEMFIPAIYEEAHDFTEGLGCVKKGGLYGFVDASGQEVIPPRFDDIGQEGFTDGLCVASKGKKDAYFYIDRKGKKAFDGEYEAAYSFKEGLAAVRVRGKWGFIDRTGAFVLQPVYSSAGSFSCGLAAVVE
jgi:hypothetical protein